MKRILITGADSYIGTSFKDWMEQYDGYIIETADTIDGAWRNVDFSGYDSVFHVAGIAHQKETKTNAHLYYEINRDLAIEVAKKAKSDGVKQFVFLSSMSVYGMDEGVITKDTKPNPKSNYGKSKWQAEQEISQLSGECFKVCIIRPPMVYGKDCKGNFAKIKKIVEKSCIFPYVKNKRSMIYVNNLSSFVKLCVDGETAGVFCPQNHEYVSTTDMVLGIAEALGKKVYLEHISGIAVWMIKPFVPMAKKAFGSLIYDDMEDFAFEYIVQENHHSFIDSI